MLERQSYAVVLALASPRYKKTIVERIAANASLEYPVLIARNAWIWNGCAIGEGSIVYAGSCLNHGTRLGRFVVVNMN